MAKVRAKVSRSGGKNQVATLKEVLGEDVIGRTDVPTIALDDIYWHPRGSKLRHPRAEDPVDEVLRDDIVEKGVLEPVVLRLGQHGGKWCAELCDGARRTICGLAAQKIMRERNSKHLDKNGNLRVRAIWIKCDDGQFLLRRRAADKQGLKKPHSARVTCDEIVALSACNVEPDRILEGLSRDWSLSVVAITAELWHTADAALRERLNVVPGRPPDGVPPGILPAVLKASSEVRLRVLDDLLAAGVTSPGGASRTLGRMARAAECDEDASVGEPDVEDDGLDLPRYRDADAGEPRSREEADAEESEEESTETAPAPRPTRGSQRAGAANPRLKSQAEAPHRRVVRRLAQDLAAKVRTSEAERLFVVGAQCGLERGEVREQVVHVLAALADAAKFVIAGVLWQRGEFSPAVQRALPEAHRAQVLALVEGATAERPKKSK